MWEDVEAMIDRARPFAFSLCRNNDDTDDVMQETRLALWRNWKQVEPRQVSCYIRRTIQSRTIDLRRRRTTVSAEFENSSCDTMIYEHRQPGVLYIHDHGTTKDMDEIDAKILAEQVYAQLPDSYADALHLDSLGCDVREGMKHCQTSFAAYKSRLYRGRALAARYMTAVMEAQL
jgi:DNA-directed RNA polymerase specialized sigma24 family protein